MARCTRKVIEERLLLKNFDNDHLRCCGTGFVGMNFLSSDNLGRLNNVAYKDEFFHVISRRYGAILEPWDLAQISICYQGDLKRMIGNTVNTFKSQKIDLTLIWKVFYRGLLLKRDMRGGLLHIYSGCSFNRLQCICELQ